MEKIIEFLYKYRYKICLIIFILCLIIGINGSSIGCWNYLMNLNNTDGALLKSRTIRSDEWAVLTPMFFSQVENGFHYFNTALRGTTTDVFMVYALPVMSIFQIFRPFLIGFILFGSSIGLSFFWCGRFIALFLISIDFFMIITNKNKLLSYLGALMITLSPIVQWWFAVNGIAEIFIFGELAIIMIYKYLNTNSFKKRLLYLLIFFICAGGYILVLYPSWQIPMFYVFLFITIPIIIENKKNSKINFKDIISIIITFLLLAFSLLCIFKNSKETIEIVTNTVYPGKRFELGGGNFNYFFSYIISIFLPLKGSNVLTNLCEEAMMFTLFPAGIILTIKTFKEKNKDKILISLLICYIFLSFYCIFGFPKILSKITLMYNSQAHRTMLAVGFLDVLLLIKSLSLIKKSFNIKTSLILSLIITGILIYKTVTFEKVYLTKYMIVCLIIMCIYLFYTLFRYTSKYEKKLFILGIVFVMFVSGFLVNPIRIGTNDIINNELLKNVKRIDEDESGIWISEGYNYPINNFIAISGVKTINVTNTYPDLEKWYLIDKEKKYEDVYNRYAHIKINIIEEDMNNDKFILLGPDNIEINLTIEDIKKLNVKYIFTSNDLLKYNNNNFNIEKIYKYKEYCIYKLFY